MTDPLAASTAPADRRWNTRDIVVVAVIAVAFGVFFWAFGAAWSGLGWLGPLENVLYAFWLLPALVAPLIVRKPGAALFAELVAASLSAVLGSQWGVDTLVSGFLQGLGAEAVFFVFRYRDFRPLVLVLASVASMALAFGHDWVVYYQATDAATVAAIGIAMLVSAIVLLPLSALALVRALRGADVLRGYPA